MSGSVSEIYAEQHRTKMTHLYQARGFMMRGMTTMHSRIEGTKAYWPTIGMGTANKKKKNKAGVPMNAPIGRVSADLETWEAIENVEKFDESRINVVEKDAQVKTGVKALGRGTDFEIIDKINAKATKSGTTLFLDESGNAFNLEHARTMEAMLADQLEGGESDIFCPVPPRHWTNLLGYKQFTSSEYIGPDLPFLRKVQAKTWNGIHFVRVPLSYAARSQPSATNFDIFMFDKGAVGWANNFTLESWWTWDNDYGRHKLRMESEGAAVVIQPKGIITGRFSQTAAQAFN